MLAYAALKRYRKETADVCRGGEPRVTLLAFIAPLPSPTVVIGSDHRASV